MICCSWNRHARNRSRSGQPGLVLVVGDGETERRYFGRLSDLCASVGIKAYASAKTGPDLLLRKTSQYAQRHGVDPMKGDLVAIVMDLDGRFDLWEIEEMDRRCQMLGYQLFISNPSFEVWLHCHFGIPTHPCTQDEAVEDLRGRLGGSYSKPLGFDINDDIVDTAIVNARRLLPDDQCTPSGCYRRNPSTMVHSLVEAIRNRVSRRYLPDRSYSRDVRPGKAGMPGAITGASPSVFSGNECMGGRFDECILFLSTSFDYCVDIARRQGTNLIIDASMSHSHRLAEGILTIPTYIKNQMGQSVRLRRKHGNQGSLLLVLFLIRFKAC